MSVEHAVMALVADGEEAIGFLGHADHFFALLDVPGHQFFTEDVFAGAHSFDRDLSMQVQGQCNDDHLDIFVGEQFLVIGIDFDVVGAGAVDAVEALAGANLVAIENTAAVEWANVGSGNELNKIGIMLADEDAAFVAGADQPRFDWAALQFLVAEVSGGSYGDRTGSGDESFHELPAIEAL